MTRGRDPLGGTARATHLCQGGGGFRPVLPRRRPATGGRRLTGGRGRQRQSHPHSLGRPLGHAAESAHFGGRWLTAVDAGSKRGADERLDERAASFQKPPVKTLLRAGGGLLEQVERVFVEEALGPDAVGTLLDDVVDAAD